VPELIAKPGLAHPPLERAGLRLSIGPIVPMTSVALFPGGAKGAAAPLKRVGLGFPAPNGVSEARGAMLVWTGRDQAYLIGAAAPDGLAAHAALTDQSDAWVALTLDGDGVEDVLCRLVPIDLSPAAFAPGSVRRSQLFHMQAILLRQAVTRFDILVFRSMARTAWHDLAVAMEARAARKALG
jgi:heterotetrameric sarcosine oxidase gamma subunit